MKVGHRSYRRNFCSSVYNCNDLPWYNSSLRRLQIWFAYIHNFIIILSRVYTEPIQRPAPSCLVSLIGRALHRYCRGQSFESRISLNFSRLSFRNCKSCVYNCDDRPSYKTLYTFLYNFCLACAAGLSEPIPHYSLFCGQFNRPYLSHLDETPSSGSPPLASYKRVPSRAFPPFKTGSTL